VACSGTSRKDQDVDRATIRCVERHGLGQAHKGGGRLLQSLDAAVRDRHALAQSGRAQPLAHEQAVEHLGARDTVVVLEQQAGLLEHALLAGRMQIEQHVRGRQQSRDQRHRACRLRVGLPGRQVIHQHSDRIPTRIQEEAPGTAVYSIAIASWAIAIPATLRKVPQQPATAGGR
jgi:hypothetical protein